MKKIKNNNYFFAIICLLILSACSMQKRLYTKGFYAPKNQVAKKTNDFAKADTIQNLKLKVKDLKQKTPDSKLVASTSKNVESSIVNSTLIDGCDTIVLKNGAKVLATIHEINLTKILFRNCNSSDETVIFIKKSDVGYINFANGTKQIFDSENIYNQPQNLPGDPNANQNGPTRTGQRSNNYETHKSGKLNPFSLISFIISVVPYPFIIILFALFGLISLTPGGTNIFALIFATPHMSAALLVPFVFVAAAIIMSIVAIYQIKNNGSDNKQGLKLAYIALILSLILLLLLLLFAF